MLKPILSSKFSINQFLKNSITYFAYPNLTRRYITHKSLNISSLYSTYHRRISTTAKTTENKSNTNSAYSNHDSKETLIYEYKSVINKLRTFFWSNMVYIYGNSILFHFEIFEPTIGYFHGLMLSLSLVVGWGCFVIVGSIAHKTIHRIYKSNDYLGRPRYRVIYLSYYKVLIFLFKKGRKRRNIESKRFD